MSFKKSTYSGTICNSYLYFAFDGNYFDLNSISKVLELKPTSIIQKKEQVPKNTCWKYEMQAGDDADLLSHLNSLINVFESKIELIVSLNKELKTKTRLQFVIDIDINPESSTPYFPFDERTVKFLAKTNSIVDFDIYKSDTIGLLNKI